MGTEAEKYAFDLTGYNFGTCYPDTEACGDMKESVEQLFTDGVGEDTESECKVVSGDPIAETPAEVEEVEEKEEDASSAAMMTSSVSFVAAAAVGTVLYLSNGFCAFSYGIHP